MISDQEFTRIASFLKGKYGIDMTDKKIIMNGRLENFVWSHGYASFTEFMNALEADPTGGLEKTLVNLLTTNHTFFMRESEHFDFMKSEVIPWIKEREAVTRDMRIWCGAASSGEEPYGLAMLLMDVLGLEANKWDTTVLATDISEDALRKAMAGEYEEEQVGVLPDYWRRRYFRQVAGTTKYRVTDELKSKVLYRKFNLMNPFPFRKPMHVIFMRNVMIYFDEPTKKELINKIYDMLLPGGYLFVGRTETLDRDNTDFEMVQPSIFRRPLDS
ncbi:MAG: protein-glutamate O-methyltransferase CheR [Lachnospiraceae bacterium]|nr:protein-glutamate O-methyltransferase CheR [Candidatus Colinaster scatohippi]